jgi:hypothetical protein
MGDNDTKDTYEADDRILNPGGKMILTTARAMTATVILTVMVVKAKAILPAAMRTVTRTATRAMVTTLIPATMVTVIATAMAANRNGYLIVTAVTILVRCSTLRSH